MATLKDIDIDNYEVKTETVVITDPTGSFTLGSLLNGAKAHDIFLGTGFSIVSGATTFGEGRDFALTQKNEDSDLSDDYGVTLYSEVTSYRLSGAVDVTYRQVGTYDKANLPLRHEARLNGHDTDIDAIEAKNVAQDNAISDLASDLATHTGNNVIHVTSWDKERWDGRMQSFVVDDITALNALTGMKQGDNCSVVVGANQDGKSETYKYNGTAWVEITDTDLNPDVMRMTNRTAAPATTTGRLSLYAEADNLKAKTSAGAIKRFADIADGAAMTAGLPAVFQGDGSIAAGAWVGGAGGASGGGTSSAYKIKNIPVGYGSVSVGSGAQNRMCSDDKYIWGIDYADASVTRISKADGGKIQVPVGVRPSGIYSDGTYVWVISDGRYVIRVTISDSTTISIDTNYGNIGYYSIYSDGTYVWVPTAGNYFLRITIADNTITAIGPTYSAAPLTDMAVDANYIWVASTVLSVMRITRADLTVLDIPYAQTGPAIVEMCSDGTYLWAVNGADKLVYRITASSGDITSVGTNGATVTHVYSDGTYVWCSGSTLVRIQISNSSLTTIAGGGNGPIISTGSYVFLNRSTDILMTKISDSTQITIPTGQWATQLINDGKTIWACLSSSDNIYFMPNSPTLTISSSDLADYLNLMLVGTMYANMTLNFPADVRCMKLINASTGNYYSHVKTASGTGVYMAPGDIWDAYCDGTNIKPIRLLNAGNSITMATLSFSYANVLDTIPISSGTFANNTLAEISGNAFVPKNTGLVNITGYVIPSVAQASIVHWIFEDGNQFVLGDRNVMNTASAEIRGQLNFTFKAIAGKSYTIRIVTTNADNAMQLQWLRITKM